MQRGSQEWTDYAQALAFVGNSLLMPMNRTETMGIDPEFWEQFPRFDSDQVASVLDRLERYAQEAQQYAEKGGNPVQQASVEYTKLFIGPPRPAAAPWETAHRAGVNDPHVGFGPATFEMRDLLRSAGLEVSNENNQYADHIGIELLYASVLCSRLAACERNTDEQAVLETQLKDFLATHPLSWIESLQADVRAAEPDSYVARLLDLAQVLLASI